MGATVRMSAGRADAMADRLARAARDAALDPADAARLVAAFRRALAQRTDITDPDAPEALHPARNALILLDDAGVRDATELCAAIAWDATRPPLPTDTAEPDAAALLAGLPHDDGDPELRLETLLAAPAAARRVALADRLDHARHLHLRPATEWTRFHADVRDVWLPIAGRTDATLARRLHWWHDMFARRWLSRART